MGKHYTHMSAEERVVLQLELDRGSSLRSIGRRLGRSPSTLSREVRRLGAAQYSAHEAGEGYRRRRRRSIRPRKLIDGTPLYEYVHDRLVLDRWSPEQIATRLRHMHPDDSRLWVSHETIYAAIYAHPRGGL